MDDIIMPTRKIRIKEYEKKIIENNRNPNLREQQNILLEDTSSDYNSNFIDFPNNDIQVLDIKKIRAFHEEKINAKANSIKGTDLFLTQEILRILDEMNTSSESNNDFDYEYDELSTDYSSYSSLAISDEKVKYWIEYKLYDNIIDYNIKKIKLPRLIQLDEDKYYYLYLNKL